MYKEEDRRWCFGGFLCDVLVQDVWYIIRVYGKLFFSVQEGEVILKVGLYF